MLTAIPDHSNGVHAKYMEYIRVHLSTFEYIRLEYMLTTIPDHLKITKDKLYYNDETTNL